MKKAILFGTGFLQVLLVTIQTCFIAGSNYIGVVIVGFLISLVWSVNVRKVVFGDWFDRCTYSAGASIGAVSGLFLAMTIGGSK